MERDAAAADPVPIAVLNENIALLSSLVVFLLIMIEVVIITSDERRVTFPFRTAMGTGAAASASRPTSRGLSVWVLPSYRRQISPARVGRGG